MHELTSVLFISGTGPVGVSPRTSSTAGSVVGPLGNTIDRDSASGFADTEFAIDFVIAFSSVLLQLCKRGPGLPNFVMLSLASMASYWPDVSAHPIVSPGRTP
jgi:hypothetical protein